MMAHCGSLTCVGVGPGDPELVTLKAARIIGAAKIVTYFRKRGTVGHARTIAGGLLAAGVEELPLDYPLTTEIPVSNPAYRAALHAFYESAAARLALILEAGHDIVALCEGDPLLYGSFMHLYWRLRDTRNVVVVPGVTGMSGCWTAAQTPIAWGDDGLSVLPGSLDEAVLTARLQQCEAAVIMKIGRNLAKVRRALTANGLIERAIYVERGTMAQEKVIRLSDKRDDHAPYFALVLVPGQGRRL